VPSALNGTRVQMLRWREGGSAGRVLEPRNGAADHKRALIEEELETPAVPDRSQCEYPYVPRWGSRPYPSTVQARSRSELGA
jgi:hypothetical protein